MQISYDNIEPIKILFKDLNFSENDKMKDLIEINAKRSNLQLSFLNSFIIRCQATKEVFNKLLKLIFFILKYR